MRGRVQLIENLQREHLSELAEAEGYEALTKLGRTVDEIAAKTGKSKGVIYARMKLLALGPEGRKAFYDGRPSASIAVLVAQVCRRRCRRNASAMSCPIATRRATPSARRRTTSSATT
jgi:ParB-like chromosome segregation protein Spo0J